MDYSKELLLFVATTLVGAGIQQITSNLWVGVSLLLIGACVFVGRGFYKKHMGEKDESDDTTQNS